MTAILVLAGFSVSRQKMEAGGSKFNAEEKQPKPYDKPAEAQVFHTLKRVPPGQKTIPVNRYLKARQILSRMRKYDTASGAFLRPKRNRNTDRAELMSVGSWAQLGPGNVGGRTRALAIAPSAPQVIYAAGVAGGVWKTTNAGESWTAMGDLLPNLAVSSLAIDPTNADVVYAGTGEGFYNFDAQSGAGIFKTTDGGISWSQIASPDPYYTSGFEYVNKLVISPNDNLRIYAGTSSGIWRSDDGGATWVVGYTPGRFGGCLDIAIRTDKQTDYVIASFGTFDQNLIMYNTDAAGSGFWLPSHVDGLDGVGRTSIAIAPSNQNIVYALASEFFGLQAPGPFQYGLRGVYRSTDGGVTWQARVRNTDAKKLNRLLLSNPIYNFLVECGIDNQNYLFNQGWYDNVIAVDPKDADRVWAGGVDLFRSDDGGSNWGLASYWWADPSNPHYVHADQHAIVFHPQYDGTTNTTMYVSNDGGVFRTDTARGPVAAAASAVCDPSSTGVNWTSLNNNYGVTQFYHGLPYPDNNGYFGGTQDNGTLRGRAWEGANAWTEILGGDGGYVAIDPTNTNVLYAENTGLSISKSTDGGSSFAEITNGIVENPDNFLFITPFTMDPNNPRRLWTGGGLLWRTNDGGSSWEQAINGYYSNGAISSIAVSPTDSNHVVAGTSDGYVVFTRQGLTSNANSTFAWTPRIMRNGYVSSVAYDPRTPNIIYATYSSFKYKPEDRHIYRSLDGGFTWTGIDGTGDTGIPDIPVHCIVIDPSNTAHLYAGTDLGVFVSLDWGRTWARENSGFADVITESLSFNTYDGATSLYAFTHGRGVWRVTIPPPCSSITPVHQAFTPDGGTQTINITAQAGCNWTAVSQDDWVTITSGNSGAGSGVVTFSVADNMEPRTTSPRVGTILVGGQAFYVFQEGVSCIFGLSPPSQYFDAAPGSGSVVADAGSCPLNAVSNDSWIQITSPTNSITYLKTDYKVSANPSSSMRTGSITISSAYYSVKLMIRQAGQGCSFYVPPASITADGTVPTTGSIPVTASSGCDWTAVSDSNWITITAGSSGSGDGTVRYSLARNNTPDFRGGHIIVAGHDIFVQQGSGMCDSFPLSAPSASFDQNRGTGSVSVTTGSTCQWAAVSNAGWITVTSPNINVGSGLVTYTVQRNTTGAPRAGTIEIARQIYTVYQDGSTCLFVVSPMTTFFGTSGGMGSLAVLGSADCDWTATSTDGWISIISGGSGTGAGTVNYFIASNPGNSERKGTIAIAGIKFVVEQAGCSVSFYPIGASVPATSGTHSISVASPQGCGWSAVTNQNWISIVASGGAGDGMITYSVSQNSGAVRIGAILVNGQPYTVRQSAAGTSTSFGASGRVTMKGGSGIAGVTLSFTRVTGTGAIPAAVQTDGQGNWSQSGFVQGTVYRAIPKMERFTFTPTSADFSSASTTLNFTGTKNADTAGVFRPSNGALYLKNANDTGFADLLLTYGLPGDYPVSGDWDGDGVDTIGIYRNGTFYLRNSNTNGFADVVVAFGSPGDQPVVGDWDGDGIDTIGVYRNGTFMLRNSNTTGVPDMVFELGIPGDVGIAGDWDGDGVVTTGVFRPTNGALYLKNSNVTGFADLVLTYGLPGDKPVTGDWDGDGVDTIGVYRQGTFMLRNSNTNGFAEVVFTLGIPEDHPISGDWNGLP